MHLTYTYVHSTDCLYYILLFNNVVIIYTIKLLSLFFHIDYFLLIRKIAPTSQINNDPDTIKYLL